MLTQLQSKRFENCCYVKVGKGFPIVLLHGFAEDHHIWQAQIDFLQQHFLLLVPDLPGSGMSALPAEEMSMELLADFVHEILLQEKIEQTILIGHSMGGYAAMAFMERHHTFLKGLVLFHSSAFEDDEERKKNRRKSIKLLQNNGKDVFLKAMIPNLYAASFKEKHPELLTQHLTMADAISSASLQAYYLAMINRPSRINLLQHTKMPIQFVIGVEDNAVPLAASLKQCHLPQIADVQILQGVGHTGMIEDKSRVNSILNSFCNYVVQA